MRTWIAPEAVAEDVQRRAVQHQAALGVGGGNGYDEHGERRKSSRQSSLDAASPAQTTRDGLAVGVSLSSQPRPLGGDEGRGPTLSTVRCYVEPSPAGGYFVRLRGETAPLSRHDTEEEAEAAAAAYERGLARQDTGEYVPLRDGVEVLVRAVRPEDKPLFVAGWSHLSDESVYKRFLAPREQPVGATNWPSSPRSTTSTTRRSGRSIPASGEGVGVARYVREHERPHVAEAAVTVVDAWQHRGLGGKLLRRLCRACDREPDPRLHGLAAGVQRRDADAVRAPRRGHA